MDSAPYGNNTCWRCYDHRYRCGIMLAPAYRASKYGDWACYRLVESEIVRGASGRCKGCYNVACIHYVVLSSLLWLLGVKTR